MAYSADDKSYASIAKALPSNAMVLWCAAANEAKAMGFDHNGCVHAAWSEVNKQWHRPAGKSRYVLKDSPDAGDVHVDAPLGSDGKKPKRKITSEAETIKFETSAEVCKVDTSLGLVFGYAIVCTKNGKPYFDLQDDHIPDDTMLKAATEFMQNSRVAGDMHERDDQGNPVESGFVVFAFPLTKDIAEAMGIKKADTTGLMIAMKPASDEMLQKFRDGTYQGFSIGGWRLEDDELE